MPKIKNWERVRPPKGHGFGGGRSVIQWKTTKGISPNTVTVYKTEEGVYETRQGGLPEDAWDHIVASRHKTKEEARKQAVETIRNWNFPEV